MNFPYALKTLKVSVFKNVHILLYKKIHNSRTHRLTMKLKYTKVFRTADFLYLNYTIMASEPNVFRVIIEISLYGRCEIPFGRKIEICQ